MKEYKFQGREKMSIKPIDLQVMIPKTSEVSKIHSHENQKSLVLQQQQAISAQNKVENQLRQVYLQNRVHEVKIRERERNNQQNREKNREEEERSKAKGKRQNDKTTEVKPGAVDIRI